MKPVTVSIFSLVFPALLSADCQPVLKTAGAVSFWKSYSDTYGAARFPEGLAVCTGKKFFFEIKGGAKMQSALDRQRGRILRRTGDLQYLNHELAHVYLDLRWRVLPYSVSEPFVLAMAGPERCLLADKPAEPAAVKRRWQERAELGRCERLQLLKDVLASGAEIRNGLPLN